MTKYIEQEAALYAVCSHMCDANRALEAIMNTPAADVAPVVHGRWVKEVYVDPYGADWTRYHCSLCGRVEIKKEPYCNCGAKMDL